MEITLPELGYLSDALAPYMSRETLDLHHGRHHAAYVENVRRLLPGTGWENETVEGILKAAHGYNPPLANNVGQHLNHVHFWKWIAPNSGARSPSERLSSAMVDAFGSIGKCRDAFLKQGAAQFGSGWVWLVVRDGVLSVESTPNGENPILSGGTPILGADVWEHAYYLDYRNARPKYLEAFWDNLTNWDYVEELAEPVL